MAHLKVQWLIQWLMVNSMVNLMAGLIIHGSVNANLMVYG